MMIVIMMVIFLIYLILVFFLVGGWFGVIGFGLWVILKVWYRLSVSDIMVVVVSKIKILLL